MTYKEDMKREDDANRREKIKRDIPCKYCMVCYAVMPTATKQCYECGNMFYTERKPHLTP